MRIGTNEPPADRYHDADNEAFLSVGWIENSQVNSRPNNAIFRTRAG
jgi:hypothetical protein